jgi:hypothetical protein
MSLYNHFTTRFRLSGDIERAKLLIKSGERQMRFLRKQLGFNRLFQGYREHEPFTGAMIRCSIVGSVRLIEIYVQPILPVEEEVPEERPCFCNCCMAECQIVKVDGTWRDNTHYDIPLPDLKYEHGDRRLRYDVDVCSFMGISAETGLLTYEFYRVENVMPSDFTPYEVGDWAMVYFTDLVRETECEKCTDCEPPVEDVQGRVWGCIPRDVAAALNNPQCIILPIAINDRPSRATVMFRPLESMQLGTCVKKCVIDWVQYSTRDEQGRVVDGYANIRWDAWPTTPGGTVVDGVPIHYCTQDENNDDGSHAFRWGNEVYLFMEGDRWTILGHSVAKLPTYTPPYQVGAPISMINPALIIVTLFTEHGEQQQKAIDPESPPDQLAIAWDFTHDTLLSFTRYAWSEEEIQMPTTPESLSRLRTQYFNRGTCDPSNSINFLSLYGNWPSSSWFVTHGPWGELNTTEMYIFPSSHTHGLDAAYTGNGLEMVGHLYFGLEWRTIEYGFVENYINWSTVALGSQGVPPFISTPADGSSSFQLGEYYTHLPGSMPFGAKKAWSKMRHNADGWASSGWHTWSFSLPYKLEASTATDVSGQDVALSGFSTSYNRKWFGLVCNATCNESGSDTTSYSFSATYTWEYEDVFYGRTAQRTSIFSGSASCSVTQALNVSMSALSSNGLPGLIIANTSSLTIKLVEARHDIISASTSRSTSSHEPHFEGPHSSILGSNSKVDGTTRYVRLEIGGSYSRAHDPFTDGADGTPYQIWDRPNMIAGITGAVQSVPVRFQHVRDYYLFGSPAPPEGSYDSWYESSYWMEDRVKLHIL